MTLEALKNTGHVIGIKQVIKAIGKGIVAQVFVAADAETRIVHPLLSLCTEQGIEVDRSASMQELGTACAIEVRAAAVAVLKKSGC